MQNHIVRLISENSKAKTILCCTIVLLISYFTYFHDYYKPDISFYDEHYYIVHAERYIHRIVFFDGNPPLGKMFIALGELIFNPNKNLNIKNRLETGAVFFNTSTNDFSFVGVRFFPSLFGFLNGLLIFLIFYRLSKNNLLSLLLSSLYLFENSSIVHFRSAMLDSTLIFFSLLTVLYFIYLYDNKKDSTLKNYIILGCLTSLAVSTKVVALVLVLLAFFLLFKELRFKRLFKKSVVYLSSLILVFIAIYYVHIALGARVIKKPLYVDTNIQIMEYDASFKANLGPTREYMKMIEDGDIYNPLKLYVPIKNYFRHMRAVQSELPKEDPTMINSNPLSWPIGIKNITYISTSPFPSNGEHSYLKFQGNPISWTLGLLALLASVGFIFAKLLFGVKISNTRLYNYMFIFTLLYVGYMAGLTLLSMKRVLYIHMYLLPLFFSFILFLLIFSHVFEKQVVKKDRTFYIALLLLVGLIFYAYSYTYPVTYAKDLSYLECEKNRLVWFWEDGCQR